jgi:hypothetical protein
MSTIIRMTRFGRNYSILLDCGHTIERTQNEVKVQQLFIEKRIGCQECELHGHDDDDCSPAGPM